MTASVRCRPGCATPRTPRAVLLAASCAMLVPALSALAQGDTKTRSFFGNEIDDREKNRVYDISFMKLLADTLNGKASVLHVVISVCKSGGFAEEAGRLTGDHSVAVVRSKNKCLSFTDSPDKDTYKGEKGYRSFTDFNRYGFGFDAQWAKKLDENANATASDCFTAAKDKEFDQQGHDNGFPKLLGTDTGKGAKVAVTAGKGEAVLWSGYSSFLTDYINTYSTLQRRGYSDGTVKNARIDSAYGPSDGKNFGGNNPNNQDNPPIYIDRKASGTNLKSMVEGLATRLTADGADTTGLVYIMSHGNTAKVKADVLDNAVFGAANQGARYRDGSLCSLDLDPDWASGFFEGSQIHTPGTTRVLPASISFVTLGESFAGPVDITLNGVDLGSVTLLGSSVGGSYRLDITDAVMSELYANPELVGGIAAHIGFDFGPGSSAREFQIATEWDVEAGLSEFYGISLEAPSVFVPAPGAVVAVGASAAFMGVRRRRSV